MSQAATATVRQGVGTRRNFFFRHLSPRHYSDPSSPASTVLAPGQSQSRGRESLVIVEMNEIFECVRESGCAVASAGLPGSRSRPHAVRDSSLSADASCVRPGRSSRTRGTTARGPRFASPGACQIRERQPRGRRSDGYTKRTSLMAAASLRTLCRKCLPVRRRAPEPKYSAWVELGVGPGWEFKDDPTPYHERLLAFIDAPHKKSSRVRMTCSTVW